MSVFQNINGTLTRMDASDLVQLAAVDTENILGGGAGATTDGQTLIDQLAEDDVQAQSDIGQIKTDLSDYHVVPSKNSLLWDKFVTNLNTNQSGTYSYNASTNVLTVASSSVTGSGANLAKEKITEIFGLNSLTFPIVVSVSVKADKTCSYIIGSAARSEYVNLTANTWYRQVLTFNDSSTLTAYNWAFYSNDTSQPTVEIKDMMVCTKAAWDADNTYEPYFIPMRDGKLDAAANTFLGAHNLIKYPFTDTTKTASNVTFTDNGDGTVKVNTSAPASSAISFSLASITQYLLPEGDYILSDAAGKSGSFNTTIARKKGVYGTVQYISTASGDLRFTVNYAEYDYYQIFIWVGSGQEASNVVFKPMIRLAYDTDPNFAKYAMTNAELTAGIVKHKTYNYSYNASTVSKNTQIVTVSDINIPLSRILAAWCFVGSTNDRCTCNNISNNTNTATILVTNEMGHSQATPLSGVLHILYI